MAETVHLGSDSKQPALDPLVTARDPLDRLLICTYNATYNTGGHHGDKVGAARGTGLTRAARARLEWAARTAGLSLSTFVLDKAAVDRAEAILTTETTTLVPVDYFEALSQISMRPRKRRHYGPRPRNRARENRNLSRQ